VLKERDRIGSSSEFLALSDENPRQMFRNAPDQADPGLKSGSPRKASASPPARTEERRFLSFFVREGGHPYLFFPGPVFRPGNRH
jgi:hypothetical protein